MREILIIIRREFLKRVRKKSFIILTLAMPLLLAALMFLPVWLASMEGKEQYKVAVADRSGIYLRALRGSSTFVFAPVSTVSEEMRGDDSPWNATVVVSGDPAKDGKVTVYSRKEVPANLLEYIRSRVDEAVSDERLKSSGIAGLDTIISDVQKEVKVETVKWNADGQQRASNTDAAIVLGLVSTFLIYMFVITYGATVMQSVLEEKSNRIVEILVSSVKPWQLMAGKIIGVMLVGLTQMALWGVILTALLAIAAPLVHSVSSSPGFSSGATEVISAVSGLPLLETGLMFVLMFIGGYLLYASFFAATGASINEQEDVGQFIAPVTLITLFGLYAAIYSVENTDGPLAFWASLFPLTSSTVMMVRIPFGVPLWQELLSLVLLYATAALMVWAGGRIYRVGILMYGKKPGFRELMRWIRYK